MMAQSAALSILRQDKHTSVAALGMYRLCPMQFFLHYIRRATPSHRPAPLVFGSAIHDAVGHFYTSLRNGKPPLLKDELQDAFVDSWRRQLSSGLPVLMAESDTPESLEMVSVFRDSVPIPHKCLGSEEAFSVELMDPDTGEVFPERLVGAFDVTAEAADGSHVIGELKTASRRWNPQRIQDDIQLSAYSWVGPYVGLKNVTICLLLLLKTRPPKLEVFYPARTEQDHKSFLRVAAGVLRGIRAGAFYKNPGWQCKSCQYRQSCEEM